MSNEKNAGTEVVPAVGRIVTTQQIEDAGLLMPLADPAALRAAFAERQRVLTSILDPDRDFLYSVKYRDRDGNERSTLVNTLTEAKRQIEHLGNGAKYDAHPKKSGCLKLAHALGIESVMVETTGLPKDPRANWSSCRYIATHKRTGRREEGQGYCSSDERPNQKMKAHAIISMADTRAYCHAVLRCAGYDNVGAEEMELLAAGEQDVAVTIQNVIPVERERPALATQSAPRTTIMEEMNRTAPTQAAPTPIAASSQAAPQAAAPAAAQASAPAPTPTPKEPLPAAPHPEGPGKGDVITNAMAAELSAKLLAKLGSKEKARAWLKDAAGVERSIHVREDQIGSLTKMLDALEAP
jgi:hypothetical protein